jgi:succinate dehydrogenase cytochrome b subunit
MRRVLSLFHSLIGKKVLMAVTGVVLLGFLAAHMYGNLKAFQGPEHFNAYAEGLRTLGAPLFGRGHLLWVMRVILLLALAGHLWAAWAVTRASWAARPVDYKRLQHVETTFAARTMRWGGIIIFAYTAYHLLDLTFGRANPDFIPGDVYHNLIVSFQRPLVAGLYIAAMAVLSLHLYHGILSGFQTLGLNHPRYNALRRAVAIGFTAIVIPGFVAVPVAVLLGVLR